MSVPIPRTEPLEIASAGGFRGWMLFLLSMILLKAKILDLQ